MPVLRFGFPFETHDPLAGRVSPKTLSQCRTLAPDLARSERAEIGAYRDENNGGTFGFDAGNLVESKHLTLAWSALRLLMFEKIVQIEFEPVFVNN
jgi:hypothetical protein